CSLTPGWSRAIWPDETPRIATWLWPGPRFCTLKLATLRATPSMSSTPRLRSSSSVGAATENGTSRSVDSRFSEVTVISSASWVVRAKSVLSVAPDSSLRSRSDWWPTPRKSALAEYVPAGTLTLKLPSAPVVAVCVARVAWLVSVTVAPGTTAPLASRTTPLTLPLAGCAPTAGTSPSKAMATMDAKGLRATPMWASCRSRERFSPDGVQTDGSNSASFVSAAPHECQLQPCRMTVRAHRSQ